MPDDLIRYLLEVLTQFAVIAIIALSAVEVTHILFLGSWNNEILSVITGLIGTITGVIVDRKA
jgi:uncharacterized membrane protein YjjP (DUF1212 family)